MSDTERTAAQYDRRGALRVDIERGIDRLPMTRVQWAIVGIMVGLNALDGFDILSISFAAPGIVAEWKINMARLGVVLSMELIGMTVGSLALGNLADRAGRRSTILVCLFAMAIGMFGTSTAPNIVILSVWRVLTGIGIGGMLATTNAAVAEVANIRYRSACVMLMAAGYPIGSILGGTVSAVLLVARDWRAVFTFGAAITCLFIPLAAFGVPESVPLLAYRKPVDALARINRALLRMGHAPIQKLPDAGIDLPPSSYSALLGKPLLGATLLLTAAYFTHCLTFYFVLKWIPKIVADVGFTAASTAFVLVWASAGGAAGALSMGLASRRVPLIPLTSGVLFVSTLLVALFGLKSNSLAVLSGLAAIAGFFTNAGVVGIYAAIAGAFPVSVRASATGVVIGFGRTGSALAPIFTGVLFQLGYGLPVVAPIMALGSIVAGVCLLRLRNTHLEPVTTSWPT